MLFTTALLVAPDSCSRSYSFRLIAGKGHLHEVATEEDAILQVIHLVRAMDPEILAGYEIHKSSWGYLIERADYLGHSSFV